LQPESARQGFADAAHDAHRAQALVTADAASENSPTSLEPPNRRRFYAKARYYGGGRGSFASVDPWGGDQLSPLSYNKYLYAYANPGVYVDPDGRISFLSDAEAFTSQTVDRYDQDIDRAVKEGAGGRAFLLGMGKGFAAVGDLVVGGLNTTSNLLARNIYDGPTREQAQREITENEMAVTNAMETVDRTATVIKEDPTGAAVAASNAAVKFGSDVAAGDPRAMAGLGEFAGQLVVPGAGAKGLKVAGESLVAARSVMRMGDDFLDAGLVDELADASRAVGRGGVDARHSPATAPASSADAAVGSHALLAAKTVVPTIGGRVPINSKLAGQTHPSGIQFNQQGFPNFGSVSKAEVQLQGLTGNYAKDAALANQAVGLGKTPSGFVWHHVEDGVRMQLVPQGVHDAARHTGGAAVIRNGGFD